MISAMRIRVGTLDDLKDRGRLLTKAGGHGVCVFWDGGRAWALDDRCPHMGFPLHRGTVEEGLVTCHWHHARFDLATGATLDPFADDGRAFPVEVVDGDVFLVVDQADGQGELLRRRLREGLEQGLTLVTAKSVLGLLESGVDPTEIVRAGVEFGTANRREGWGAGLTVLVAMANLLPWLDPEDRALALVHGLAFVSRDTRTHAPAFTLAPLGGAGVAGVADVPPERLASWYRRFIETRSGAAAERALVTAVAAGRPPAELADTMLAAATDHVFLDGGHTLDFTNKAFEALELLGWDLAPDVLPTVVDQTAGASRSEEGGRWRHPHDLVSLLRRSEERVVAALGTDPPGIDDPGGVSDLGWRLLGDDPAAVSDALCEAAEAGATAEQLGRALALAAGLRVTRFHTQNDFGDWDTVHHGFTAANALHQCLRRHPSPQAARGAVHGALKVYLDRFLNVPAARLPAAASGDLADLQPCWDGQGGVDRAGAIAYGYLEGGGDPRRLVAALGHCLLAEDAQFHWYQTVEAGVAQYSAWPQGSEEGALLLAGTARFLAAHTPTRRELPHVVRIAARLRRGEDLFEEE
jgi:nitrite reductase/ring-hydroxylating ferredoxin subunit